MEHATRTLVDVTVLVLQPTSDMLIELLVVTQTEIKGTNGRCLQFPATTRSLILVKTRFGVR